MSDALEHLKPLTSTILAGLLGIVIWLLIALERPEPTERRIYLEARIEHAAEVAKLLGRWEDASLQLLRHCSTRGSPSAGKPSAALAAEERRAARELLAAEFGALSLYFDAAIASDVRAFVDWESATRDADCSNLPTAGELRDKTGNLIRVLRASVVTKEFRDRSARD